MEDSRPVAGKVAFEMILRGGRFHQARAQSGNFLENASPRLRYMMLMPEDVVPAHLHVVFRLAFGVGTFRNGHKHVEYVGATVVGESDEI